MKNKDLKKFELNRNQLRGVSGGKAMLELEDDGKQYKCCWAYSDNCSTCVSYMGSCVSGAVLTVC